MSSADIPIPPVGVDVVDWLLRWALLEFGDRLKIACSLSVEDNLLVHVADEVGRELGVFPKVFVLDTGRMHPETYETLERLRTRYRVPVEVYVPDAARLEALVNAKGLFSFRSSVEERRACCDVRKVEPLGRALAGANAWVTGLRRAQSSTRGALEIVERDDAGRVKLNPLVHLSDAEVWQRARALGVVIHPLHGEGYPQIGCQPCTRAVSPGEDARAGRWWWEASEHKECGIHLRRRAG